MALTLSEASALLLRAFAAGRVAHAYLIHGTADARLLTAVEALAGRLVALDQYPAAGGDVWRHPDVYRVEPQGRSRGIAVDQVRELEGRLQLHAAGVAGKKVAVMVDAERMNDKAANAFLKTLEEPPPNSHIFLVSEFPDQLPETVLSRCVEVGVRAEGRRGLTEHERMLLAELDAYAASGESGVLSALALGRRFQAVLAALKEEVVAKVKAMAKAELARMKEVADKRWLEEREEYYDVMEVRMYSGERVALLDVLEIWWGDVLRANQGFPRPELVGSATATAAFGASRAASALISGAEAIGRLRSQLDRSVNESLAIEVAFMEAFV